MIYKGGTMDKQFKFKDNANARDLASIAGNKLLCERLSAKPKKTRIVMRNHDKS